MMDSRPIERIRLADLPPVARTLLIPLAYRAIESQRAFLRDTRAVELLAQFDEDLTGSLKKLGMEQTAVLMRSRQLDRWARAFLAAHPGGIVVDIGCGLDTRGDRLCDGQVVWYGLDLPEVIELRRRLLPEGPHQKLIARSAIDFTWMDIVATEQRPVIFLAEGVLPYLDEEDVRHLVLALVERFPGSELAFDAINQFSIWLHSRFHPAIRKAHAHLSWGLDDGRIPECWGRGIRLVEEWWYFTQGEPRLGIYNILRHIPLLARANYVLRYRLGAEDAVRNTRHLLGVPRLSSSERRA